MLRKPEDEGGKRTGGESSKERRILRRRGCRDRREVKEEESDKMTLASEPLVFSTVW